MVEDVYLLLGDSWYVVLAFIILGMIVVILDVVVSKENTQSHRDTILFNQIEEFRRDFS